MGSTLRICVFSGSITIEMNEVQSVQVYMGGVAGVMCLVGWIGRLLWVLVGV